MSKLPADLTLGAPMSSVPRTSLPGSLAGAVFAQSISDQSPSHAECHVTLFYGYSYFYACDVAYVLLPSGELKTGWTKGGGYDTSHIKDFWTTS